MSEMLEAALDYARAGFPVFPLSPNSKKPFKGSRGFKGASCDEAAIRQVWANNPDANIGLATHDLLVVDIDGANNPWPTDPDQQLDLSNSITCITPSGGRHHYFLQPEGKKLRNTTGKLAPNVDTRGDGGYVLLPPSVVDGKVYVWRDHNLASDHDMLARPAKFLLSGLNGAYSDESLSIADVKVDNLILPDKIAKGKYNDILIKSGGFMRRMGASEGEILAIFRQMNKDRFEDNVPDTHLAARAKWCAEQESDIGTEFGIFDGEPIKFVDHSPDPGPMPEKLMHCPGFIDNMVGYSMSIAHYPNLTLSFAGALAMLSMIVGGKVCDITGARTNLYVIALALSGVGKNIPRIANKNLAMEAQMHDNIMDKFASGEGMEEALLFTNPILFQPDEINTMFESINRAKDARHENMLGMILTLFTESGTAHIIRRKAEDKGKSKVIYNPSASLLGTAIPSHFYESFSPKMLTSGLLTRCIIVENSSPRKRAAQIPNANTPIPDSVLEVAEHWREASTTESWEVPYSPDATELIIEVQDMFDDEYGKAEVINDNVRTTLWSRCTEMTRKLALIAAVSRDYKQPMVDVCDVEWACAFVKHQAKRMIYMVNKHIGDGGQYSKDYSKLTERLGAAENNMMSMREIMRAMNKPKKDVLSLIESMEAAGAIKRSERKDARGVPHPVMELNGEE